MEAKARAKFLNRQKGRVDTPKEVILIQQEPPEIA